jgi:hypothetical protein
MRLAMVMAVIREADFRICFLSVVAALRREQQCFQLVTAQSSQIVAGINDFCNNSCGGFFSAGWGLANPWQNLWQNQR